MVEPRLGIVIPARNEGPRIGTVLASLALHVPAARIYVVDDGSEDATAETAQRLGARIVRHRVNLGKGAALRTGCEAALRDGVELLVVMDADGQHAAEDVPRLIAPIAAGEADLVLGRRRFSPDMPALMRAGNWGLSALFALLFRRRVEDTQCGLRAFAAAAYSRLAWHAHDYSVETEMLVRAIRAGLRVTEVRIETVYNDRYKGTTPADGVRILGRMVGWRLSR